MSYFAPYIDSAGLHLPTYEDRLEDLLSAYRSIFGPDAVLTEAVPDYQLLSVLAKALDDTSALVLQAYNSRNPLYASGQALTLLLPLYGLTRLPEETDAQARARVSRALSARGAASLDAISSALRSCPYVKDAKVYVNDTDAPDARGIPAHSLAAVVYGGDGPSVARALFCAKAPGIGTFGTSSEEIPDASGTLHTVRYSRTISRRVYVFMTLRRLAGCDEAAVTQALTQAVNEYINTGLSISEPLIIPRLYAVAYNANPALSQTFAISDIYATVQGETAYTRDEVSCPWNARLSILSSGGLTLTFQD